MSANSAVTVLRSPSIVVEGFCCSAVKWISGAVNVAGDGLVAAAALPAVAAPQSPQNFSPGSFSVPHAGHTGLNGAPHCAQNFRPSRLSVPHFEQCMLPHGRQLSG
jgi:hypothetical protein